VEGVCVKSGSRAVAGLFSSNEFSAQNAPSPRLGGGLCGEISPEPALSLPKGRLHTFTCVHHSYLLGGVVLSGSVFTAFPSRLWS